MNKLDPKIRSILERLDVLIRQKAVAAATGRPVLFLDVEINALRGALEMRERKGGVCG